MRERIFRIKYCDKECGHPEMDWCFILSKYSLSKCVRCEVKEITEDWICDDCDNRFDKFTEYFEVYDAPEVEPEQKTVKLIVLIKRLCRDCYEERKRISEEV